MWGRAILIPFVTEWKLVPGDVVDYDDLGSNKHGHAEVVNIIGEPKIDPDWDKADEEDPGRTISFSLGEFRKTD